MKRIYSKNELAFSLLWIGLYVVLMSAADGVSEMLGVAKIITAPLCIMMALFLFFWVRKNGLSEKYGFCRPGGHPREYLYYIPLVLMVSVNLWWGIGLQLTALETVLSVISMLCVGFLEEVIFRGFLFKAMCRNNVKSAVVVSSITFGMGHIVNLLSGAELAATLIQIVYAVAGGFLFTVLFYRGKSLWPCIFAHSAINSLSVFSNDIGLTLGKQLASGLFLTAVSIAFGMYILIKRQDGTAQR